MGFFSGCMDARNMTSIEEVKCPKCGADIEVFVRDGKTVGQCMRSLRIYDKRKPDYIDIICNITSA